MICVLYIYLLPFLPFHSLFSLQAGDGHADAAVHGGHSRKTLNRSHTIGVFLFVWLWGGKCCGVGGMHDCVTIVHALDHVEHLSLSHIIEPTPLTP